MWCFLIVFRNKSKKMVAERQKQTALPERRAPSAGRPFFQSKQTSEGFITTRPFQEGAG